MTPSGVPWERVKEVFHGALLLPAEDREAFLAGSGEAEAEVRSLLEAHE